MNIKIIEQNEQMVKAEAKFNASEFEGFVNIAYEKTKGKYNLQGFRKGKAPRKMIEQAYGETCFYEEAINDALSDAYKEFLDKHQEVTPYTWPEISVKEASSEKGLVAELTFALAPTVKVGKYKGLKVKVDVKNVTDEEINAELAKEQERHARLEEVAKEAKNGDTVNIDFEGFVDGKAFEGGKAEGYDLVLGSGSFIPGFEDQLVGTKAGDEKDVNVTFPTNYGAAHLAGKNAVFKCKVHGVKEKILPVIDDEFAKEVSEFNSLDEYKNSIKETLEKQHEAQASINLENKIVEKIVESSEFTINPQVIDDELNYMLRDMEQGLANQGLRLADYLAYMGKDEAEFRASRRNDAEKMVKSRLVFTEIIKAENLTVTDEEAIKCLAKRLANQGASEEQAKTYFEKVSDERRASMRNDALLDKLLDFLKNNNV